MDDTSIIKPILDALDYFNNSPDEINYFYNIIDKFCANWFGKQIKVSKFDDVEYLLIHDLLGEYIRFEENNKRIALWLLSINRVCYNYTSDLSSVNEKLNELAKQETLDIDATLIEPILNHLRIFEKLHNNAGKDDRGEFDVIINFLQWVMVYTSLVYPSLENKMNFYDKVIIKAMNFILMEFIKQRSNDKRMAYLIIAIIEACRLYSIQEENINEEIIHYYEIENNIVLPGKDEVLVTQILDRLKDETQKPRDINIQKSIPISIEKYVESYINNFIENLNKKDNESIAIFNKYIFVFSSKFLSIDDNQKLLFLRTFIYMDISLNTINTQALTNLKKSINNLADKTKIILKSELKNLENKKDEYINYILKKIDSIEYSIKYNTAKLFILVLLVKKLNLY
jgi:hypothetical protein